MSLSSLEKIVGAQYVQTNPNSLLTYGRDWTQHLAPNPLAVVFPQNTEQVQKLVQLARSEKTPLVPSGGRTGLSAGAYALNKEIVVSFEKMNQILSFNSIDQTVNCEAGVITENLQNYVANQGFYFPVDFASRGSSQIGGNIATNAGGIKVIRYGLMRDWVAGLTVVTGKGQILHLNNSLVKNASGYDLRHLFIGSEGTLGFITEATLKVTSSPHHLKVFVLGTKDLQNVMNIYETYKKHFSLTAYEMFTELAMEYVLNQGHVSRPFATPSPYYILMELEINSEHQMEKAMELFEHCMESGWVEDGTISQNDSQARNLWRLREDITESISNREPYKNDISVRVSKVPEFLTEVHTILKKDYPDYDIVWFGHIGDGNLHINVLKPNPTSRDEFLTHCQKVSHILFSMVEKYGGSISAEHGVGLTKKPFLHHSRCEEEITLMRQIKSCFDPDGILNPGKIFD